MGAKLHGLRGRLNDNHRRRDPLNEIPIPSDELRHAPEIFARPDKSWFCIVSAPQNEFRCADRLKQCGVLTYVPTDTHWTLRSKARERYREQVQTPIFRGYVFARLSPPSLVDYGGGPEVHCGADWRPVRERDAYQRNPCGILGVIGFHGLPLSVPLRRIEIRDGERCRVGVADFADDERAGWFDDRRRPGLIAERDAKPEARVMAGEVITPVAGPFAGQSFTADNDNDERGFVRLRSTMFGGAAVCTMHLDELQNLTRPQDTVAPSLRRA